MRKATWMVLVPATMLAAACGGSKPPAVDDALKNDLALAAQAQPNAAISPTEAGYAPTAQPSTARQAVRTAPVRRSSVRHSSHVSRSSAGEGSYDPGPAPAPPVTVVKHTERDAAIGAAAGAVLGASTSRDKVKGGLIGAAVGGVLGGMVGNNVDITRKVGWP